MKKIIFVIITAFTSVAQAHYCDTVPERNRCWSNMADLYVKQVNKYVKEINNYPLDPEYKKEFNANHQRWARRVNDGCKTNACVATSSWDRAVALSTLKVKINRLMENK